MRVATDMFPGSLRVNFDTLAGARTNELLVPVSDPPVRVAVIVTVPAVVRVTLSVRTPPTNALVTVGEIAPVETERSAVLVKVVTVLPN